MGYAGDKQYNIKFDKDKYRKSDTQKFLARLIEYELDYFVEIDASNSFDINGNTSDLMYIYDFGDDTEPLKTNKSKVKHQYMEPGVYIIYVTVMDKYGNTSTASLSQRIADPRVALKPKDKIKNNDQKEKESKDDERVTNMILSVPINRPYARLTCDASALSAYTNQDITFDASVSHDVNKDKCKKFKFNFGDGQETLLISSAIIKHKYIKSGKYIVNVIVIDRYGLSSNAKLTIVIQDGKDLFKYEDGPSIWISSSPTNCYSKSDMKWMARDRYKYTHQYHHMLMSKTGKSEPRNSSDVNFSGIKRNQSSKIKKTYFRKS